MLLRPFVMLLLLALAVSTPSAAYAQQPPGAEGGASSAGPAQLERYRLHNGLRVVLAPDESQPRLVLCVSSHLGSQLDSQDSPGAAWLLHQLMSTGIPGSAQVSHMARARARGVVLKAGFAVDESTFIQILPAAELESSLELEAARLGGLTLTPRSFTLQRNRQSRQRLAPATLTPLEVGAQRLRRLLFQGTWSRSRPPRARATDLSSLRLETLQALYAATTDPSTLVVTLVGNFEPENARELIEAHLGGLSAAPKASTFPFSAVPPKAPVLQRQSTERFNATVVQGLDTPLALYAWPTPAARGGPSVALQLAGQILTQPGSRLAQSSTGSKPLTLAVQSRSLDATGPGALIVSLRIKQGATVDQASKLLDAELQRLARAGPSASELERARSRLGEQLDAQLSNAETRASQLGHYELHDGDAALVLRQARKFGQVTAAQVAQAAALYLTPTLRTTVELYPRGWPQDPDPPIVRRRHTVQAGDTLIGIAKHYGSTAKAIAKANGLRTRGFIYPGQSLVVPVDTRIKQPPKKKVYTVKRGDSMSVIAKRHGVSTRALAEENRRKPNQTIVIGETLTIPLSPAQKSTGSRKPEGRKHRVKSGDTLLGLAHRYGVSARSIAQANGRRETQAIFAGETLSIPPAEPRPTQKRR